MSLFPMQTLFSSIRVVGPSLQINAILKLTKLALCPLATIVTQSPGEGRYLEGISKMLVINSHTFMCKHLNTDERNEFV
ncbi:MAG: hypothetical protein A2169_06530 [Deltaproteobacteria bacterium RBG_13_47_9]|nr:MAG: hypothetical protein A2169_06530 [Deltaproteobacteria bacterium RBG_13_47_9]